MPSHPDQAVSGGGPATRKSARTRKAILDAAGQLFTSADVNSVKVEDIADGAGVSVGTLYKHFANKQGILLAFVSEAYDVLEADITAARELPRALDRVYAAGDAYMRVAAEHPHAMRFGLVRVLQPNPSPELAEVNRALSARTQKLVLGVATDLKEAMREGQTAPAPIDETMLLLWAMWSGMTTLMIRQDGTAIPPELAERALRLGMELMRRGSDFTFEHPESPPLAGSTPPAG
ncbi:MAG: TetR/AcrR family transcriptional regulator [Solirubrobacteraceae bacterium]|nr:TetR/AcrR family transcriptional regulator [Solirubrobacteraceae bacterium]